MSQVSRMADCPETMDEARAFIDVLDREVKRLRADNESIRKEMQAACDHEWENVDDSFSHEFGTEVIRYTECTKCGARKGPEDADGPDCDDGDERP